MEHPGNGRSRLALLALCALVVTLAYLDSRGAAVGQTAPQAQGAVPGRSAEAREAEAAITRTNLVARLESALGEAFGEVWFEPGVAQLYVGVTSPESRRRAGAVAESAGLAESVTAVAVDSTRKQLVAEQQRLNRKLADLFAREEVSTALRPEYNAVAVELGSAVPRTRRERLEREASSSEVAVLITVASEQRIRLVPVARCSQFEANKARCDPTIVAGVTIKDKGGSCTAGPAVRPKAKSKPTDTYILTAGHCIDPEEGGGGEGASWFAFNKKGEEKEVGEALEFLNGATDVGVIWVENPAGYWAKNSLIPVEPTIAPWDQEEPAPFSVVAERVPSVGTNTCFAGQTSGVDCGEVVQINAKAGNREELVKVKGVSSEPGDSGAPFFAETQFKTVMPPIGYVEGTFVGKGDGEVGYFQPLEVSFSKLKTGFELLTDENKTRHPVKFELEEAPAILTGGTEEAVFSADAGEVTCEEAEFAGELTEVEATEFEVEASYFGCEALGLEATVEMNGCQYAFKAGEEKEEESVGGRLDIVCPEGEEIEITTFGCRVAIGPQSDVEAVSYTNAGSESTQKLEVALALEEVAYEEHNVGFPTCADNTVPKANGGHQALGVIEAESEGSHVGIWAE